MVAENRGDKVILVVFMRVGGVFLFLVFFGGCAFSPGQPPGRERTPPKIHQIQKHATNPHKHHQNHLVAV